VAPLRELRSALSEMRLNDLAVGAVAIEHCYRRSGRALAETNQATADSFLGRLFGCVH